MATAIEETGLTTRTEQSFELAPSAAAAEKQFEIQSAIVVARKFARNEEQVYARLMKAALRPTFADEASYSFKRGKKKDEATGRWVDNFVEGPSVNLAREAARIWGNIRYGLEVIRDDEESRQIRGWAWDLETNVKVTAEDDFKKLVQRKQYDDKGKSTGTAWVTADERDLRELTNRRGAILIRNCILQLIPSDVVDDIRAKCDETLRNKAAVDPEGEKKKVIIAFASLNITPDMLESALGHKLAECSPAEIAELRKIYKSVADGNSTWKEYATPKAPDNNGKIDPADLAPGKTANRGHGKEGLDQVGKNPEPKKPAPIPASASPTYSEDEPDPFAPGGDLFSGEREPGQEG